MIKQKFLLILVLLITLSTTLHANVEKVNEDFGSKKERYDIARAKWTMPFINITGDKVFSDGSEITMLTPEVMHKWYEYNSELFFYDKEKLLQKEQEVQKITEGPDIETVVLLKLNEKFFSNKYFDLTTVHFFLLNNEGTIVQATSVKEGGLTDTGSSLPMLRVRFPRRVPGTFKSIFTDRTTYLKVYAALKDSLYMAKFEYFKD